ncbi:MAG TPA: peptidase C25, partial [Thermoplasmatales archaeon]|nr:peptidase C25 [Thermoplasmatales archaeon]
MKRKIIVIILMGLLFLSGAQAYTLNSEKISDTILLPTPNIIDQGSFITVRFPIPTALIAEPGKPVLPRIVKTYRIPFGSTIQDIDVYFSNDQNIYISKPIQIGEETIPSIDIVDSQGSIYPNKPYEYFVSAGREDNHLTNYITLICYPIQYIPAKQMLSYSTRIDISIEYIPPVKSLTFPDEYDLLIIAPQVFSQALQPLVEHKNNVGIRTILKTTEEIYQEYQGVDKPEQIKYCIKDMIETYGIKYVLLVGGLKSVFKADDRDDKNQGSKDWYLPVRYSNVITTYDPGMISDLYYADIYDSNGNFSSWDSNGDGIFGSFKTFASHKDIIDLFPDVAVGRLACRSIDEVETMVDKIITYESETYGSDWFKRFVLVGGDTFDDIDKYVEGEIETQKSYDYLADDGFEAI